jgi:hypothetical protein
VLLVDWRLICFIDTLCGPFWEARWTVGETKIYAGYCAVERLCRTMRTKEVAKAIALCCWLTRMTEIA